MSLKKIIYTNLFFLFFTLCLIGQNASAHENYVLTQPELQADMSVKSPELLSALNTAGNMRVAFTVALFSFLGIVAYYIFQNSKHGKKLDKTLNSFEPFGHTILRFALAVSLFASAYTNSFLGPEIPLAELPLATFLQPTLYLLSAFLLFGLWTELVSGLSLVVLLLATWVHKDYMLTYFNYFGEFIVLLLLGSRIFSLDRALYKAKTWAQKFHDHEIAIIRITYGISILHPAIVYKLMHPQVIVDIATRYNLMQFHWLFPQDPLLIALGSGLAQVAVGLFIIFGFQTRLSALVSFILMSMSVLYFKEAVWPHYILLALALYLIINNGGKFTLDNYLSKKFNRTI